DGKWTDAPDTVAARLATAASLTDTRAVDHCRLARWLELLAVPLRQRLMASQSHHWAQADPAPAARRLATRLQRLVRDAARRHEPRRLAELEGALAFVSGGHTAGEAILVEQLSTAPGNRLAAAVSRLPKVDRVWDGFEARLTGLILFGPTNES